MIEAAWPLDVVLTFRAAVEAQWRAAKTVAEAIATATLGNHTSADDAGDGEDSGGGGGGMLGWVRRAAAAVAAPVATAMVTADLALRGARYTDPVATMTPVSLLSAAARARLVALAGAEAVATLDQQQRKAQRIALIKIKQQATAVPGSASTSHGHVSTRLTTAAPAVTVSDAEVLEALRRNNSAAWALEPSYALLLPAPWAAPQSATQALELTEAEAAAAAAAAIAGGSASAGAGAAGNAHTNAGSANSAGDAALAGSKSGTSGLTREDVSISVSLGHASITLWQPSLVRYNRRLAALSAAASGQEYLEPWYLELPKAIPITFVYPTAPQQLPQAQTLQTQVQPQSSSQIQTQGLPMLLAPPSFKQTQSPFLTAMSAPAVTLAHTANNANMNVHNSNVRRHIPAAPTATTTTTTTTASTNGNPSNSSPSTTTAVAGNAHNVSVPATTVNSSPAAARVAPLPPFLAVPTQLPLLIDACEAFPALPQSLCPVASPSDWAVMERVAVRAKVLDSVRRQQQQRQ